MRILIMTPYAGDLFGQERVLRDSTRLLRQNGHEVFVVTEHFSGATDFCDELLVVKGTSTLNQLSSPKKLREVNGKILDYLDKTKPDVVHFIDQFDYRLTAQIQKRFPTLLSVHTVSPTCPASTRLIHEKEVCGQVGGYSCLQHMSRYHCMDSFRGFARKFLAIDQFVRLKKQYVKVDQVVAVSNYIKALLVQNGWSAERISVVYNPVEVKPARPLDSAPPFLLSCVSRLEKLKGIDVLLRGVAEMKSVEWELWICGDGPERDSLLALASGLGIAKQVRFLGKTPFEETQRIIASSRGFIQANVAPESFGLAAVEAAAQGVPVIAANIPALNEVLKEGSSAVFFPPGDFKVLANALQAVLAGQFNGLTKTAAQSVKEKFSPKQHLEGMLEAYECALSRFHNHTKETQSRKTAA